MIGYHALYRSTHVLAYADSPSAPTVTLESADQALDGLTVPAAAVEELPVCDGCGQPILSDDGEESLDRDGSPQYYCGLCLYAAAWRMGQA
jgi:hypothetical protein